MEEEKKTVSQFSNQFKTRTLDYTFISNESEILVNNVAQGISSVQHGRMWVDYLIQRDIEHIWTQ